MLDFCFYLFYRASSAVVAVLPLRVLFAIGKVAGFGTWLVLGRYRRLALHNVGIAFGSEKSKRERQRIVRRHFQQVSANLLCSIKHSVMPLEELDKLVETENFDIVDRHLRAGRPVVLVLSHLGSWELFAQTIPRLCGSVRIGTVYQKLRNRFIDAHVGKIRRRSGAVLFDRSEGFQKTIELLRSGGLVGVLSDQHAGDHGLWTPFFGRLASTTSLPALLAKRTRGKQEANRSSHSRPRRTKSSQIKLGERRQIGSGCTIVGRRRSRISCSRVTNAACICRQPFQPKIYNRFAS
jgi:lauroyl/myristoyl acyltransferase